VNVNDLLERSRSRLEDRARQSEMMLRIELTDSPAFIMGDDSVIDQILLNLVDNACKYGYTADHREIFLDMKAGASTTEFRVSDLGPGILKKDRRRLFKAFHKSAHEAAHSADGVGLGLALCRRLARQMNGDLTIDDGYSEGARFVLSVNTATDPESSPNSGK
jgi:K+-sensing histidine kinase KdpD